MSKPLLYDVFSGAGGCAVGYHRAGFRVVGIDKAPQPRFPFEFYQLDAFDFFELVRVGEFEQPAAWHCSPPCQAYAGVTSWRGDQATHQRLIAPTRRLLEATGLPYVIENVQDARRELINPIRMCGSQFGLTVRRHRYFEANWPLSVMALGCHHKRSDKAFEHKAERAYADAMGCQWMTTREARQAVPPAMTEAIGIQLAEYIRNSREDAQLAAGSSSTTSRITHE